MQCMSWVRSYQYLNIERFPSWPTLTWFPGDQIGSSLIAPPGSEISDTNLAVPFRPFFPFFLLNNKVSQWHQWLSDYPNPKCMYGSVSKVLNYLELLNAKETGCAPENTQLFYTHNSVLIFFAIFVHHSVGAYINDDKCRQALWQIHRLFLAWIQIDLTTNSKSSCLIVGPWMAGDQSDCLRVSRVPINCQENPLSEGVSIWAKEKLSKPSAEVCQIYNETNEDDEGWGSKVPEFSSWNVNLIVIYLFVAFPIVRNQYVLKNNSSYPSVEEVCNETQCQMLFKC